MTIKHNPTEFHLRNYKKEITDELESGKDLVALFLTHGFIESYLVEWLYYSGSRLEKRETQNIEN